jgi:hypothetical protein
MSSIAKILYGTILVIGGSMMLKNYQRVRKERMYNAKSQTEKNNRKNAITNFIAQNKNKINELDSCLKIIAKVNYLKVPYDFRVIPTEEITNRMEKVIALSRKQELSLRLRNELFNGYNFDINNTLVVGFYREYDTDSFSILNQLEYLSRGNSFPSSNNVHLNEILTYMSLPPDSLQVLKKLVAYKYLMVGTVKSMVCPWLADKRKKYSPAYATIQMQFFDIKTTKKLHSTISIVSSSDYVESAIKEVNSEESLYLIDLESNCREKIRNYIYK